jgi:hypothetical protein
MPTPVPLVVTGSGVVVGGGVGCCAMATPATVTVDAIASAVIQDVRVMVVTSLVSLGPSLALSPDHSGEWAHPTAPDAGAAP